MFVRSLALVLAVAVLSVPAAATPASATPDNFTPRSGVTFNSPVGGRNTQRKIYNRLIRSIDSSPRGSHINIFSWNFLTQTGKDKLLRAQRRGVRVRLLMDDRNLTQIDNPPFRKLRRGLRKYNRAKDLPGRKRSWARVCRQTCRSGAGSAHSKFFMFSKAGKNRRVVMQGSANFTIASTTNQWNDIYTHTGNRRVWKFYSRIFGQAAHDRRVRPPFAKMNQKPFKLMQFPIRGKNAKDPVMQMLRRVKCHRARNTPHSRTRIQIAPDVLRQNRGMWLARKLRALHDNGCRVRIGYTVVGKDIGRYLRKDGPRGPVPMRHLVQDFNQDGQFDNYFHLKAMVIRGHYGSNRRAFLVMNGSANWSGVGKVSDENVGIYRRNRLVRRYLDHLDYWYDNFPSDGSQTGAAARRGVTGERLIFGNGKNAEYEDGQSVTGGVFDPFAQVEMD
jgi:phosphatidylserine/phosphatidylglycerophosphate/cardiolipin synthase-like enzyme